MHILWAFIGIIGGFIVEVYTFQIVRTFGHQEWAERRLGPGGTYVFWRIVGIAMIIGGFWMFKNPIGL